MEEEREAPVDELEAEVSEDEDGLGDAASSAGASYTGGGTSSGRISN